MLFARSGSKLRGRDTVNEPNPTRQVTLIRETGANSDVGQTGSPVADEVDRLLQSQMHDVAVRADADRPGEHAREVERAAAGYSCKRGNFDRFIEVRKHIVLEPFEDVLAQRASPA